MRIFDDPAGLLHIFLIGLAGAVEHYGGKAAVDAGLAQLKGWAVVQVQGHGHIGIFFNSSLDQLDQVGVVGVFSGARGDL